MKKLPIVPGFALLFAAAMARPADAALKVADIADLDLEQLTNVTVTSASRREERIVEAPASIYVISAEDIRRSGATTLPEALRLAPNLQVARADTSQYVISARGNLSGTANKMLVLIDGRTVYTPLFAGVFWDAQNVMIEDVERIEVISGPGSTLWGTNAVNGVINVITRGSAATQGALVVAGAGTNERGVSARAGATLAEGGTYRVYGKYFERDDHELASGASARDESERWQVGFRTDWQRAGTQLTVQGDVYRANVDNLAGERPLAGGNLLGRWRSRGEGSETFVQAYYDRTERVHEGSFKEDRDTFDVEAHHALKLSTRLEVVVGGGYRTSHDRTVPTPVLAFMPNERTLSLASLFGQVETEVLPRLRATAGLRVERNSYTGVEWLPNLRLQYALSPSHTFWSAVTRAARSPSRIDRDLVAPGSPPFVLVNNDSFRSEIANVFEVGYRAQLLPQASISLTAFRHDFRELWTLELLGSQAVISNGGEGRTTGIEGWGDYAVSRDWRLSAGFVVMDDDFELKPGRVNLAENPMGNNPNHTAMLRSLWNITRAHELDILVRHSGALAAPAVPAYTVTNARFGWRVTPNAQLSVRVENVFNKKYSEFGDVPQRAVFERTFYVSLACTL